MKCAGKLAKGVRTSVDTHCTVISELIYGWPDPLAARFPDFKSPTSIEASNEAFQGMKGRDGVRDYWMPVSDWARTVECWFLNELCCNRQSGTKRRGI